MGTFFVDPSPYTINLLIAYDENTFFPGMSAGARDLCTKLLERKPESRLQDEAEFKQHVFFTDMDFEALLAEKLKVPFVPDQKSMNFEAEFTDLPARHSVAACVSASQEAGQFDTFHFDRRAHRKQPSK